jgi:hypothetical protein
MQPWIYSIEIKGTVLFYPLIFFKKSSENYLPLQSYHAPGGVGCASAPAAVASHHNATSL